MSVYLPTYLIIDDIFLKPLYVLYSYFFFFTYDVYHMVSCFNPLSHAHFIYHIYLLIIFFKYLILMFLFLYFYV